MQSLSRAWPAAMWLVVACTSATPRPIRSTGDAKQRLSRARLALEAKQYAECSRLFAELESIEPLPDSGDAYDAACCHALANQSALAFRSLEQTAARGYRNGPHLRTDPDLSFLHESPRWKAVLARVDANEAAYLRTVHPELFRLFRDDQADRMSVGPTKIDWPAVEGRDEHRRRRVSELLEAGEARVSDDYLHAAVVFQHGPDLSDYQRAHALALKAVELDATNKLARWVVAASKDRELVQQAKPQRYGTQFIRVEGKWVLCEVDPSVTDEERARWNVPPLATAKERAASLNQAP